MAVIHDAVRDLRERVKKGVEFERDVLSSKIGRSEKEDLMNREMDESFNRLVEYLDIDAYQTNVKAPTVLSDESYDGLIKDPVEGRNVVIVNTKNVDEYLRNMRKIGYMESAKESSIKTHERIYVPLIEGTNARKEEIGRRRMVNKLTGRQDISQEVDDFVDFTKAELDAMKYSKKMEEEIDRWSDKYDEQISSVEQKRISAEKMVQADMTNVAVKSLRAQLNRERYKSRGGGFSGKPKLPTYKPDSLGEEAVAEFIGLVVSDLDMNEILAHYKIDKDRKFQYGEISSKNALESADRKLDKWDEYEARFRDTKGAENVRKDRPNKIREWERAYRENNKFVGKELGMFAALGARYMDKERRAEIAKRVATENDPAVIQSYLSGLADRGIGIYKNFLKKDKMSVGAGEEDAMAYADEKAKYIRQKLFMSMALVGTGTLLFSFLARNLSGNISPTGNFVMDMPTVLSVFFVAGIMSIGLMFLNDAANNIRR